MSARLCLTCGDPAGVGPELLEAWAADQGKAGSNASVIAPESILERLRGKGDFDCVRVGEESFDCNAGEPSVESAVIAIEALNAAAEMCRKGEADAVVTAPSSKLWMDKAGFGFPGHTEYFADQWGGRPVMAFAGGRLRVVLATWHIPLREVPDAIDRDCLEVTVNNADRLARAMGVSTPSIGVCGLNPHAGEDGLLGVEERDTIDPILESLRSRYAGLSSSLPADTAFRRQLDGEFDVVVALYHDQGLAPLKTLEFEKSVNITLGLPWIRTSPDHGTAYAIAGKGSVNTESFRNAVDLAAQLSGNRVV